MPLLPTRLSVRIGGSGVTGFSVNVESAEFARILSNTLPFFPARSPVKVGRLEFEPGSIVATATDTYTIGRDTCDLDADIAPIAVEVNREGWQALQETARKDKAGGWGRIEYHPGDALVFTPSTNEYKRGKTVELLNPVAARDMTGERWEFTVEGLEGVEFWRMCDELLERMDGDVRAFDPDYLGRFGKVRLPKDSETDKVLDLLWQGQTEPMLARVGPSFIGAIMPVDRLTYAENNGKDALW